MFFLILIITFSSLSLITKVNSFNCGFGTKKIPLSEIQTHDPSQLGDENKDGGMRFLQSSTWEPIRIHVDYTSIEQDRSISSQWLDNVKQIVNTTINLLQSLIMVRRLTTPLRITSCDYSSLTIPRSIYSTGVNADLVLFVLKDSDAGESVEAWAVACALSQLNKRPVAGIIGLSSRNVNFIKRNWLTYFVYLLLHEVTHVLVFAPDLFRNFWNESTGRVRSSSEVIGYATVNGERRTMIKTPKVLEEARKHFNCNDVQGIELENQGGSGSAGGHWESRVMLGDYMIAASYEDIFISEITLGLFEDSGWYQVNKYTGGLFKFGKDAGCNFLNEKCIVNRQSQNQYFCDTNDAASCMVGDKYKGFCSIQSQNIGSSSYKYFGSGSQGGFFYADFCPIANSYSYSGYYYGGSCAIGKPDTLPSQMQESISNNSGCFNSSLLKASSQSISPQSICYQYYCNDNLTSVVIRLDGRELICPPQGGVVTVSGFTGQLYCPHYNDYCNSTVQCYDIIDCINKKSLKKEKTTNLKSIPNNVNTNVNIVKLGLDQNNLNGNTGNPIDNLNGPRPSNVGGPTSTGKDSFSNFINQLFSSSSKISPSLVFFVGLITLYII